MTSDLGYLSMTEKTPLHRISAHYEQLSQFEGGRIIGLKEAGWANRRIARHMGRSDVAIGRCWQKWVDSGLFQGQDGSGRPRATADLEDRLTVRLAVETLDSSLSTIRSANRTRVSSMTIHRRKKKRNLPSYHARIYATYYSRTHTVEPDYSGVWLDHVGIMLTGDVWFLEMNPITNCVLTIIEDVSVDA
ncbi:HTH_Tnp_Tc3_2 domain-containing protein [Trichonephila clavipes]|nr:HTH_Tnp_Tc3_2 domain-containing protein [Trichonephila clavipes]